MQTPIYLDHNATTPLLPEVLEAMRACYAQPYYNPASQHAYGRQARCAIEAARERVGELLGANMRSRNADQVIFTSGGTEANNLAVLGLAQATNSAKSVEFSRPHAIVSALEHPSVSGAADELSRRGWQVSRLPADSTGIVRVDQLQESLRPETRLVAVMLGQNETGVLQPVAELAAICAEHGVPLHTDAAQVVGKLPVDFRALRVATMTVAAHKFHGPLGIGALVARPDVEIRALLFGGVQQRSLRPGTESVALAVGMCRALELWQAQSEARTAHLSRLRDQFEAVIIAGWPDAVVIGQGSARLPHTSSITFPGLDRQALFMALDQAGVACSTGSACASGSSEPSSALVAMGLPRPLIDGALRFSFGATTTPDEAAAAARRILFCCKQLWETKTA
jgi:cysteine desulfurase